MFKGLFCLFSAILCFGVFLAGDAESGKDFMILILSCLNICAFVYQADKHIWIKYGGGEK